MHFDLSFVFDVPKNRNDLSTFSHFSLLIQRPVEENNTEAGGEAGTSQLHSRQKNGYITNIYLTYEEAIENFVKDHKELYCKTNGHFKNKVRKECLWETFPNSHKRSVKVSKTYLSHKGHVMARSCNPKPIRLHKR